MDALRRRLLGGDLGGAAQEFVPLGFAAVDLDSGGFGMTTTTKSGRDGGNVDIWRQRAHTHSPPIIVFIENRGDIRAFGASQEVDQVLSFGSIGVAIGEQLAGYLSPEERSLPGH